MADQQSAYSPDEILAAAYPGMGLKTVKLGNKTAVVHESMADGLSKANADFFAATGKNIMPASSFRTKETQQKLYNELHPTGAAVAKPGNSRHEKGLALDVGNWMAAAPYLKKYGLDNPIKGDANHFQLANKPKATPLSAARNMVADASGRATPPASENAQSDPSGYTIEELYKAAGKDIPIAAKKYSGYTIGEIQNAAGVGGGDQDQPGQIPPPRPVEGPLAPGARPPAGATGRPG